MEVSAVIWILILTNKDAKKIVVKPGSCRAIHFMTMRPLISVLTLSSLLTSCMEVDTKDPKDSFKYWAGQRPPDNVQVINGQYWQSGHWTKEYILHLKLKPTEEWWNEYVKQNNLKRVRDNWTKPSDFPDW